MIINLHQTVGSSQLPLKGKNRRAKLAANFIKLARSILLSLFTIDFIFVAGNLFGCRHYYLHV